MLGGLATATACKKDPPVVRLPDAPPAERTAQSFVQCVESRASQCVEAADQLVGWDSFYLLAWLAGGSPLAILEALPAELADHADPRRVQRRFVDEVERYSSTMRGAVCTANASQPIDPLIDQVGAVAGERLQRLGLWQANMLDIIAVLVEESHEGLGGGTLVRLDCERDPFRVYVATRERDGRYAVVGMTTLLPGSLTGATAGSATASVAGEPPAREVVDERLRSRALGLATASAPIPEGLVDRWMGFPVEEF
ncbi:hypothetical protein [Paraliomyxa miuraensis]|uniref:hypothetical protein n=1 Tax=Paraliomyxa miuraensis TaxID=376150 RepID=UPI00225A0C37|nr:hypothetical protein [Paraliomyxa miuraensis]MCX4243701.1 hypothetical protein [Paraliomyxa miuraensis]